LWSAASAEARLVIAGLFGGLTLEEIAGLRFEDIDFEASVARVHDAAGGRNCTVRDPFRRLLLERRHGQRAAPLADAQGRSLPAEDLEGLVACAACDAGLASPGEITAEALRHTYFAYLVRQGARLAEIGEFVGRVAPAAFREYGRLSPPGPGLPLESIEPVFPALRAAG
jgi:integrase